MKLFIKITIWFFSIVTISCAGIAVYLWYIWSSDLPHIGLIKEYRPPIISEVFSDDGEVIGRFWDEKRIIVPLDQLPLHLIHAFVAAEDARFFRHEGVDIKSIIRAFFKNLTAAKIEQGASTITQQVTRALLLKNNEKTYRRKVREITLSFLLEKKFNKDEILFFYLNKIYLGQGAYGVEAAARTFFNKSARDLNIAESALLAGLPQAPSRYSPISHFDRAKARQEYVLERMHAEDFLTDQELKDALEADLEMRAEKENVFERAPYFTEHIRRYLHDKYGWDQLYRGGLKVYTTLDLGMQSSAIKAIKKGLTDFDKRKGYRGPIKHLTIDEIRDFETEVKIKFSLTPPEIDSVVEGLVGRVDDKRKEVVVRIGDEMGLLPFSAMKWARKPDPDIPYYLPGVKKPSDVLKAGDVILVRLLKKGNAPFAWELSLEQTPEIEGALFCMAAETGEVKAMVGGRDFGVSQFNRAIQSRRQPGSAFKPLIYSAALDRGMSPATMLMDSPYISDQNPDEEVWKPKNYKDRFFGLTLLRTALAKSRNVITVKILEEIKVPYAIKYAKNMGIKSKMSPDLSLALGSSGVSLEEITKAYSVFTNAGMLTKPIFIKRIIDRNGQIIEESQPEIRRAISKETAFIMTDLLRAVIQGGTGWRVKALKRPAAGKTGTTNDMRDAWFVGYTPELVTGVWVGYDDRKAMGKSETGSRAASPIWLDFMSDVLTGLPIVDFKVPDGVVFAKIDMKTGLLASPYSDKTVFQAFRVGTEPKEYSRRPEAAKQELFMQFDWDGFR